MRNLKKYIKNKNIDLFLEGKKYDEDSICEFIQDPTYLYLTNINVPNINIYVTDNQIVKSNKNLDSSKKYLLLDDIKLDIDKMRMIKNRSNINNISKICKITKNIINFVKKNIKIGMTEIDVKNMILERNYKLGGYKLSFKPICAFDESIVNLHHKATRKKLKKNSIILIDIGFKYNNYCSDISRVFPATKFNNIQKILYTFLLQLQKNLISKLKENINFDNLNDFCLRNIFNFLIDIKIIKNNIQYNKQLIKCFMYHLLGHSIGLEVHDPMIGNKLLNNMVITIEPGIYFNKSKIINFKDKIIMKNFNKYSKIGGMRIEDVILVKKKNFKILS